MTTQWMIVIVVVIVCLTKILSDRHNLIGFSKDQNVTGHMKYTLDWNSKSIKEHTLILQRLFACNPELKKCLLLDTNFAKNLEAKESIILDHVNCMKERGKV